MYETPNLSQLFNDAELKLLDLEYSDDKEQREYEQLLKIMKQQEKKKNEKQSKHVRNAS